MTKTDKTKPRFKLGDTVLADYVTGTVTATVMMVPTRRSRGFLFGGQYAYTLQEAGNGRQHRTAECHMRLSGEPRPNRAITAKPVTVEKSVYVYPVPLAMDLHGAHLDDCWSCGCEGVGAATYHEAGIKLCEECGDKLDEGAQLVKKPKAAGAGK